MVSISKRGDYQFQAIIRRKGYPSQTKTFEPRREAERWAREIETHMDTGYYRDRREIENTTLSQGLQKYLELISSKKRGFVAERNRIRQFQRHSLANRALADLQARDFVAYRDERLGASRRKRCSARTGIAIAFLHHCYQRMVHAACA